jgi:hypothetical protein
MRKFIDPGITCAMPSNVESPAPERSSAIMHPSPYASMRWAYSRGSSGVLYGVRIVAFGGLLPGPFFWDIPKPSIL